MEILRLFKTYCSSYSMTLNHYKNLSSFIDKQKITDKQKIKSLEKSFQEKGIKLLRGT
jgi:F0F1-type ATP synthase delta subunit